MKVSIELLDDSAFDLEEYIAREFAYAFGAAEEQAFCVGTGTGQPTGLFTANGGTVGVTAASATAVTTDEVISLIYALKAPYRKNAKFLMNDATVSALRKLKDSNGQYLWQPSMQAGQLNSASLSSTDCSATRSTPVRMLPRWRRVRSPLPSATSRATGSLTAPAEPFSV